MEPHYNLLYEPWIPVWKKGEAITASLADALLYAHEIENLASASPLEEAALIRLLLAVLHRAFKGPESTVDLRKLLASGKFPEEVLKGYFKKWHQRFYLFHPEAPFFQVGEFPSGYDEEKGKVPWTKLLPELAVGHNPTLFNHSFDDEVPPADFALVARALIVHQNFACGGTLSGDRRSFGVTSGKDAPLVNAAVFIPQGKNLFETLTFNLCPYFSEGDIPVWEEEPPSGEEFVNHKTKVPLSGLTRIYTWRSRSVRLIPDGKLVRHMLYGPGVDPIDKPPEDPHCAYKEQKGHLKPLGLQKEKLVWRDFASLLPPKGGSKYIPPRIINIAITLSGNIISPLKVVGQISIPGQNKILDIRREVYPFPRRALESEIAEEIEAALRKAEELGSELGVLALILAEELLSLARYPGSKEVKKLAKSLAKSLGLEAAYWAELDHAFPAYLLELSQDPDQAWKFWMNALRSAAQKAWKTARAAAGERACALKALAIAERNFRRALGKHLKEETTVKNL